MGTPRWRAVVACSSGSSYRDRDAFTTKYFQNLWCFGTIRFNAVGVFPSERRVRQTLGALYGCVSEVSRIAMAFVDASWVDGRYRLCVCFRWCFD